MLSVALLAVSSLFMTVESAVLDRVEAMRHPDGLFLDRASDPTTVSSAATGFGVLALAEGASRGMRDAKEVSKVARTAFEKTVQSNPLKNRGWLSHFTDVHGSPKLGSEVSTIDTAIFYAGLLRAAELLQDEQLRSDVELALKKIDRDFMMRDGVFLHGFTWRCESESTSVTEPEPEIIPYRWNDSSEGLILYKLFNIPFPLEVTRLDYPLFVYAYPLVFFDAPEYEEYLQKAIRTQIERYGYWGVTSTDGPSGYVTFNSEIISPILISAIATKYPEYLSSVNTLPINASTISVHLPSGWTSNDELAIDLASAYVLHSRWTPRERAAAAEGSENRLVE